MPLTVKPPRKGRSPNYTIRGTHLGIYVEQSAGTSSKQLANRLKNRIEDEIERGVFATPGEPTFASAAVKYMEAGGKKRFMAPLIEHFREKPIRLIDQAAIDDAASTLYPNATPATKNRQVHTPVSAVLKRAGRDDKIKRPIGWRGKRRTRFLWPEQAFRIFAAAETVDLEFHILLIWLCYTGPRKTEGLSLLCDDLRLDESFAYLHTTKNQDPRGIHLPDFVVETFRRHPRGLNRPGERVFRFRPGGHLDWLLYATCVVASGLPKTSRWPQKGKRPPRIKCEFDWVMFHTFCHTYGTWMRRYGGVDDLTDTGRWKTRESADVYVHAVPGEAAQKSDLLPTPKRRA